MISAELDTAFIERVSEGVVVNRAGYERPITNTLSGQGVAHSAELEVAEPQLAVREAEVKSDFFDDVTQGPIHAGVRLGRRALG